MILTCMLDKYGDHTGKSLKYITTGIYKDMLCVLTSAPWYHNKRYYVNLTLQSRYATCRTSGNLPNYIEVTDEDFFDGLNTIDEKFEDTKTNLEFKEVNYG